MSDAEYPSDVQFAGLVEAATAAADQEVHWSNGTTAGPLDLKYQFDQYAEALPSENGFAANQHHSSPTTRARKRKRDADIPQIPREQYIEQGEPPSSDASPTRSSIVVSSSAALFRQPSTTSKKFTRPPMSKLYASLEISAESFLHLQSAAKAFMLDDDYPERRDCVGQRGRGDTDLVKLKLWNCVKEFLDERGNGDKFFGAHVPSMEGLPVRTTLWPRDAEQIIKSCVPLLRRMVTNERQRQYAVETRKGVPNARTEADGHEAQEARKTIIPISNENGRRPSADTMAPHIPDLLDEQCVMGACEAAELFDKHMRSQNLEDQLSAWSLNETQCRVISANVDGHLRLFHGADISKCDANCKRQAIECILEWDQLYGPGAEDDARARRERLRDVVHQLFVIVQETLMASGQHRFGRFEVGKKSVNGSASMDVADRQQPAYGSTSSHSLSSVIEQNDPRLVRLQINLVFAGSSSTSSTSILGPTRRVVPSLTLPGVLVPNLSALRSKISGHYGPKIRDLLSPGMGSSASQRTDYEEQDLNVRVWLPDGLVRVKDDGEWMVALLSAEVVEWMDREIKILVELPVES